MNKKQTKVPRATMTLEQEVLTSLGRSFRIKRNDLGLKKIDLQEKSGVTSWTISKLESGKMNNCSLGTLVQIATALEMKIKITVE